MQTSKINRVSPSMIGLYLQCPVSFYYQYIAKIHLPQKQIHLLFGSAIHKAIEEGVYKKNNPFDVFKKVFIKDKLLDEEKEFFQEYVMLGKEMIKNYINSHSTLNSMYNLNNGESEIYVKRTLVNPLTNEKSSLPMSGRIDRLVFATNTSSKKQYNRIVEYKTAKNKWNENDSNYKIQTLMYDLWFYSEYGIFPDEIIYIILLKKYKKFETDQTYQILTVKHSLVDLAATFDEIELIIHKINNNEFERPKGYHPRWCDCYKYEEALNIN